MAGRLSVVATPIGNLEDITLRAIRVLGEADVILCEDTRVTKRLLERHGIAGKKVMPYNEQRSGKRVKAILELLEGGKSAALVTDAGTPGISDPGTRLVRIAHEAGIEVVAIPGPSALAAAISVSGLPSSEFVFLGFLPHKKGREKLFKEIAESRRAVVFYESPHRIERTLNALAEHLGERGITIARELTKIHEEVLPGTAAELLEKLRENKGKMKGEFVVLVAPR